MTIARFETDLLILAADLDTEMALHGILSRRESLGIRRIQFTCIRHPDHDPGCLNNSVAYVRPYRRSHAYALVVFDREGCGREGHDRDALEREVELQLVQNGWDGRSAAVVVDPELEAWVWSPSPHVEQVLGWAGREPSLRQWLRQEGLLLGNAVKPTPPKGAMQRALRVVNKSWSSALHLQLAERVGLRGCVDPAFVKLRTLLSAWFPAK